MKNKMNILQEIINNTQIEICDLADECCDNDFAPYYLDVYFTKENYVLNDYNILEKELLEDGIIDENLKYNYAFRLYNEGHDLYFKSCVNTLIYLFKMFTVRTLNWLRETIDWNKFEYSFSNVIDILESFSSIESNELYEILY